MTKRITARVPAAAFTCFVIVCIHLFCYCLHSLVLLLSAFTCFVIVCIHLFCYCLHSLVLLLSAFTCFVIVCIHLLCYCLHSLALLLSAFTCFVIVCIHLLCYCLHSLVLLLSAFTCFVIVCIHLFCYCLHSLVLLLSAFTCFVIVCIHLFCYCRRALLRSGRGRTFTYHARSSVQTRFRVTGTAGPLRFCHLRGNDSERILDRCLFKGRDIAAILRFELAFIIAINALQPARPHHRLPRAPPDAGGKGESARDSGFLAWMRMCRSESSCNPRSS